MNKKHIIFLLIGVLLSTHLSFSKENISNPNSNSDGMRVVAAGCLPATAQTELNINNVKTLIMAGGDMWGDLNDAYYEIPNGSNKHSMFAGALWIGGLDDQDNLKVASSSL